MHSKVEMVGSNLDQIHNIYAVSDELRADELLQIELKTYFWVPRREKLIKTAHVCKEEKKQERL